MGLALCLCAACGSAVVIADPMPGRTSASPSAVAAPPRLRATPISRLPQVPDLPGGSPQARAATPASLPTPTAILLPSPTAISEIELLFTGDINPGRCVYAHAKQAGDLALPYRPLAGILQGADITVGSLDGAISDYNPPTPCVETTRNLLAPAEAVYGLQFAGFDVMAVATNHIKDCGLVRGCVDESMLDTLANLRAAGIEPAGAGRNLAEATVPAIVSVGDVRFAFIGVAAINAPLWATEDTPGTAPFRSEVYLDAIRRAGAQADVVVVLPHWGREFSPQITFEQRKAAQEMVDAGAALVVGNHPHRVQGVENFPNGAVVAYALGNFAFDMTWSDGTQYTIQGLMLKATFRGAQLQAVDLIPIHIYDDFQPRLAPPEEAQVILREVADSLAGMPAR